MNTTRPPFDDLKVRQAVNYAVDPAALERIYAGQLDGTQQILPPGMPGYEKFDLYPHDMAKAEATDRGSQPVRPDITVWTDNESPNNEAGAYYQDVLKKLGFNAKLKIINADNYFTVIGNEIDARPRHRLVGLVRGLPAPERLLPAAAGRGKHPADQQHELRPHRRPGAEREDRQARRRTARARSRKPNTRNSTRNSWNRRRGPPTGRGRCPTFVSERDRPRQASSSTRPSART